MIVQQLHALLDGTDIEFLEIRTPSETIRVHRDAAKTLTVKAPVAGVFLHRHHPGQTVAAGEVVGLLRIGILLIHVTAPCAGMILDITANDGSTVGYGAPLLRLEKT
jgi:acetyl-CoA carboxylase biotin carboxyl carrier protein